MDALITEPLPNGARLPKHPAHTTSLKVIRYGKVHDATDGKELRGGLHQNELRQLRQNNQMALTHLYAFCMIEGKIYHTRRAVVITVDCIEDE